MSRPMTVSLDVADGSEDGGLSSPAFVLVEGMDPTNPIALPTMVELDLFAPESPKATTPSSPHKSKIIKASRRASIVNSLGLGLLSQTTRAKIKTADRNKVYSAVEEFLSSLPKREARKIFDAMMLVETKDLSHIEARFRSAGNSLSRDDFIGAMMQFLPFGDPRRSREDDYKLAANLVELFDRIDMSGDEKLSWEEFSTFVIETGLISQDDSMVDIIRQYRPSLDVDKTPHIYSTEKIQYIAGLDRIVEMQRMNGVVRLYRPKDLTTTGQFCAGTGTVMACEYVAKHNQFVTSTLDHTLSFWDISHVIERPTLRDHKDFRSTQLVLRWSDMFDTLFAGGTSGSVRYLRLKENSDASKLWKEASVLKVHGESVTDLQILDTLDTLATASMDANIRLWNVNTGQLRKQLVGHAQGITCLTYNPDYRYLFTSGFDYDIFVWNPFMERMIIKLTGHGCAVLGVSVIPDTPQVVSADVKGRIRVWDIRKTDVSCVQEFGLPRSRVKISSFTIVPSLKRIVAADRAIRAFDYGEALNPQLTDDLPCVAGLYIPQFLTFFTSSGQTIKCWDGETGRLMRVYRKVTDAEITSMCLDHRGRKIFVGDHSGNIKAFNPLEGTLKKKLEGHNGEITCLVYTGIDRCVVSGSRDGLIKVHEDCETDSAKVLKVLHGHKKDVTAVAFSQSLGLLASGSADCQVNVWDYETVKLDGQCTGHTGYVSGLLFIEPYPVLLSTDSEGFIYVWLVKPAPVNLRYRCMYKSRNLNGDGQPCPVLTMQHYAGRDLQLLFTGDDSGDVKIWSIRQLLSDLLVRPVWNRVGQAIARLLYGDTHSTFEMEHASMRLCKRFSALIEDHRRRRLALKKGARLQNLVGQYPVISKNAMPSIRMWRAHSEGIRALQAFPNPSTVITASFDCMVRVWDWNGRLLGTFRQGDGVPGNCLPGEYTIKATGWQFPASMQAKNNEDVANAKVVLTRVEASSKITRPKSPASTSHSGRPRRAGGTTHGVESSCKNPSPTQQPVPLPHSDSDLSNSDRLPSDLPTPSEESPSPSPSPVALRPSANEAAQWVRSIVSNSETPPTVPSPHGDNHVSAPSHPGADHVPATSRSGTPTVGMDRERGRPEADSTGRAGSPQSAGPTRGHGSRSSTPLQRTGSPEHDSSAGATRISTPTPVECSGRPHPTRSRPSTASSPHRLQFPNVQLFSAVQPPPSKPPSPVMSRPSSARPWPNPALTSSGQPQSPRKPTPNDYPFTASPGSRRPSSVTSRPASAQTWTAPAPNQPTGNQAAGSQAPVGFVNMAPPALSPNPSRNDFDHPSSPSRSATSWDPLPPRSARHNSVMSPTPEPPSLTQRFNSSTPRAPRDVTTPAQAEPPNPHHSYSAQPSSPGRQKSRPNHTTTTTAASSRTSTSPWPNSSSAGSPTKSSLTVASPRPQTSFSSSTAASPSKSSNWMSPRNDSSKNASLMSPRPSSRLLSPPKSSQSTKRPSSSLERSFDRSF